MQQHALGPIGDVVDRELTRAITAGRADDLETMRKITAALIANLGMALSYTIAFACGGSVDKLAELLDACTLRLCNEAERVHAQTKAEMEADHGQRHTH